MKLTNVFLVCLLLLLWHTIALAQIGAPIQGRVTYQGGTAAVGARVVVASACHNTNDHLAKETLTGPDGRFSLKSYDPYCNTYQFSASHRENFWLSTGDNIFYLARNGTTPQLEIKTGQTPTPVLIRLEQQGGEVELSVFDEATQSYVFGELRISRESTRGRKFPGSLWISTDPDGSPHTIFVPPGKYAVKLSGYHCHGKSYFSTNAPTFEFTIEAGIRHTLTLRTNISELQAKPSSDNPKAERCGQ